MRVRDHAVVSAAGAILLSPWSAGAAAGLWIGGVLIDADHYAWFCVSHRSLNPLAAVRFFNEPQPPQHPATRILHTPAGLAAAVLLGLRYRRLLPVALGMCLHVLLDQHHQARMDQARTVALARDRFCCRGCGSEPPRIGAHVWRQPRLLPSYQPSNLVSLCGDCHNRAHTRGRGVAWWS